MLQRELEFARKIFDSSPKFTFSKWRQLVEEGLDHGRVKDNHDKLEADPVILNVRYQTIKKDKASAYINAINHGTKRSPARRKM